MAMKSQLNKEKHSERYNYIRTEIVEALGENALDYIQNMDEPPSILAIKVPPKIRYNVLSLLSAEGIQTTWYYYPINRINRYQKYISQEDEGSAEVAGSVVILPFQWRHSDLQVESLAKALRKIKGTL